MKERFTELYHSEKTSLGHDAMTKSTTQEQVPSRADGVGQAEVATLVETLKCELEEPGEGIDRGDGVQATRFTPPLIPHCHTCVSELHPRLQVHSFC